MSDDVAASIARPSHDALTATMLRWRVRITAVVVLLVGAATLFLAVSLLRAVDRPWTGLTLARRGSGADVGLVVRAVARGSPAEDAGLRRGDIVLRLADTPAAQVDALGALHDALVPGSRIRVAFVQDGRPRATVLVVDAALHSPWQWAAVAVRLVVVFGLFFALAALVYHWRPNDPRALLFMLVSAAFGTSLLMSSMPGGLNRPPETVVPLPEALSYLNVPALALVSACGVAGGPLLLHFVLLFPRPRLGAEVLRPLLAWSYLLQPLCLAVALGVLPAYLLRAGPPQTLALVVAAMALLLALAAWPLMRSWWRAAPSVWLRLVTVPGRSAVLAALAGIVASQIIFVGVALFAPALVRAVIAVVLVAALASASICLTLVYPVGAVVGLWSAWTFADAGERQQIRWPLLGIAATLTTALVLSVGAMAWSLGRSALPGQLYTVLEVVTWVAYSFIPLSFATAILRYGLMDIRVIVRLTFIYAVTSASVAVGAGALVLLISALVGQAAGSGRGATIVLTLLVVAMVEPVRRRIQRALDVRFYQKAPDPAGVLARHGEALRQVTRREDLERRLVVALQEAVPHRPTLAFRGRDERAGFEPVTPGNADPIDMAEAVRWLEAHSSTLHGPIIVDTEGADARTGPWRRLDVELLLPIRHAEVLHLVVGLGRKRSDERWSERDLELLSSIAAQTSMAISGLQTRVRDASLREAFDNQQAMLPQQMPQPTGYSLAGAWHPALAVGGDYYDAWWLTEDAVAVCIADVSGKGLPASLVMANLQATVKALAAPDVTPAALCTRVNQTMAANLRRGRFVTFFFGILWTSQHRFAFANAGHNPPLLVQPSVTRELGLGDPALGLRRVHDYRDAEVMLEPGARLLLFTDGITEGRSPEGEEFGTERLEDVLARAHHTAPAVRDDVLSAIAAWTQGRFDDDVTMLAVVRQHTGR
jgi:serine phosphatase RsbU (regulator of sigma subunit)